MVEAMKIKAGFKQTEVGVIPNDWNLFPIEDLTPKNRQYTIVDGPFGSNLKTIHYRKSGIPIITSGYVTDGKFSASEYLYVDLEKFKQEKRSAVRGGDIVMAKIGERCGASAILPKDHQEGILSGNALKITIDENRFSKELIAQILWGHHIKGNFKILRTTGAQPAISMANLKKYKIPLPPTKTEQIAIATALNDADALIAQLGKLIAKKRAIKQGVMQELLKPKEGWEVKKLGEIFEITAGGDYKKEFSSNTKDDYHIYPIYSNSLSNKGLYGYCTYFSNEPNCVTVTARGTIGYSCYRGHSFTAIGRLLVLKPKKPVDCFYFSEYINSKIEFVLEVTGVPQLTAPQISQYEVSFPKAKAEQTRIAQTLSDMDAEIEVLEKKLKKHKMLKQGMMQNLLTGRIRLV